MHYFGPNQSDGVTPVDGNADTLANWTLDAGNTIPAPALPGYSDDVSLQAQMTSGTILSNVFSGGVQIAGTISVHKWLGNPSGSSVIALKLNGGPSNADQAECSSDFTGLGGSTVTIQFDASNPPLKGTILTCIGATLNLNQLIPLGSKVLANNGAFGPLGNASTPTASPAIATAA